MSNIYILTQKITMQIDYIKLHIFCMDKYPIK